MPLKTAELIDSARSFSKDGRWFRDSRGRYLIFRGVNFGSRSKLAPYLPIAPLDIRNINQLDLKKEIDSVKPELDLLKQLGFNIIRLLISWKAIEPKPNPNPDEILPESRQYLGLVKEIIDTLYARGLYVLLDFHQDIAHEIYGGDGFPDWALGIDAQHPCTAPENLKNDKWGLLYYDNPTPWYKIDDDVRNTLRSFWQNSLTNTDAGL